jgi:hypothetical protein
MPRKPRIVVTIVTETGTIETSIVKGREMANGQPSPGPSSEQFDIARRAVHDLIAADGRRKS